MHRDTARQARGARLELASKVHTHWKRETPLMKRHIPGMLCRTNAACLSGVCNLPAKEVRKKKETCISVAPGTKTPDNQHCRSTVLDSRLTAGFRDSGPYPPDRASVSVSPRDTRRLLLRPGARQPCAPRTPPPPWTPWAPGARCRAAARPLPLPPHSAAQCRAALRAAAAAATGAPAACSPRLARRPLRGSRRQPGECREGSNRAAGVPGGLRPAWWARPRGWTPRRWRPASPRRQRRRGRLWPSSRTGRCAPWAATASLWGRMLATYWTTRGSLLSGCARTLCTRPTCEGNRNAAYSYSRRTPLPGCLPE